MITGKLIENRSSNHEQRGQKMNDQRNIVDQSRLLPAEKTLLGDYRVESIETEDTASTVRIFLIDNWSMDGLGNYAADSHKEALEMRAEAEPGPPQG